MKSDFQSSLSSKIHELEEQLKTLKDVRFSFNELESAIEGIKEFIENLDLAERIEFKIVPSPVKDLYGYITEVEIPISHLNTSDLIQLLNRELDHLKSELSRIKDTEI